MKGEKENIMERERNNRKEEYDMIISREKELKEKIENEILSEDHEEWKELFKTIELKHSIEIKSAYEKGVQQGAYYQRIIDCKEDRSEFIRKEADD